MLQKGLAGFVFSVIPGFGMLLSWVQSQVTLWQDGAEAVSEECCYFEAVSCMSHLSPPNYTLCACLKDEMATIPDRAEGTMGMATRGGNVLLPHTD